MTKGALNMLRNLSLFTRRFRPSPFHLNPPPPPPPSSSLFSPSFSASKTPCSRFFSSENTPSNPPNSSLNSAQNNKEPIDVEDISNEELKRRVAKLRDGDDEAIPSVFEAILQRYLAGKPIEDDQELMKDILGKRTDSESEDDDLEDSSEDDD